MKFNVDFEAGKSDVTMQKATAPVKMEVLLENIATAAIFESEIIPQEGSGLISLRKGFGRLQIVYQVAPQVHTVKWDYSEGTQNKKTYQLAEPWKIIISDYDNGSFLGSRHFYSPDQILSYDQPLYVINLPNTNTTSYGGTSIGWICHYHYNDTTQFSISEMINYAVYRESGLNEPYNDANMSGTDGPRFYARRKAPAFMTDPTTWQKKTKDEGVDWTLDPNLWQVIKIDWKTTPSAEAFSDKGEIYTLGDAVFRPYYCYYPSRKTQPFELPLNIYRRLKNEGKNPWAEKELLTELGQRWRVSKVESKNTNKGSQAVAAQLSPEDVFEKLKTTKIPNLQSLQIKWISDGEECNRCQQKIKTTEGSLINVAIKHSAGPAKIRTVESYLQTLDSLLYGKWCDKCVKEAAVKLGEQFNYAFNSFVSTDLVEWSMEADEFYLKISSVQCKFCMALDFPIERAEEYLFYDVSKLDHTDFLKTTQFGSFVPDIPENSCCIKCIDLYALSKKWDAYQVTESNETCPIRFVGQNLEERAISFGEEAKEDTLFYKFLFTNLSLSETDQTDTEKYSNATFETKAELVPIDICNNKGIRICPCNLPSTDKGLDPCASCIDKKGEYKPFSEQFVNMNNVTITPIEIKDPSDA